MKFMIEMIFIGCFCGVFRSITKILGDWWANLDNDEKTCYTDLAKQVNIIATVPFLGRLLLINIE